MRKEQWEYYLNECVSSDKTILDKVEDEKPANRWIGLSDEFGLAEMRITDGKVRKLATAKDFLDVRAARALLRGERG